MTQSTRTLCLAASLAFAFVLVNAESGFLIRASVAQTVERGNGMPGVSNTNAAIPNHLLSVASPDAADEGVQPVWRYTRFGWQDANEWTSLNAIVSPPQRGIDQFHPLALAMLILFSVLAAVVWASNEWEVAQLLNDGALLEDLKSG